MGANMQITQLDFDKHVDLKGLGGLKNVIVLSTDISHSDGEYIIGHIVSNIPNPSPLQLEPVGVLNFDVYYKGIPRLVPLFLLLAFTPHLFILALQGC